MILKINWSDVVDKLANAKNEIVFIMPAIHEEWIEVLKMNPIIKGINIFACIDNSEEVIRNGYGSLKGLKS